MRQTEISGATKWCYSFSANGARKKDISQCNKEPVLMLQLEQTVPTCVSFLISWPLTKRVFTSAYLPGEELLKNPTVQPYTSFAAIGFWLILNATTINETTCTVAWSNSCLNQNLGRQISPSSSASRKLQRHHQEPHCFELSIKRACALRPSPHHGKRSPIFRTKSTRLLRISSTIFKALINCIKLVNGKVWSKDGNTLE